MSGLYQSHLRCDEKIAAEVEMFRQERFPDFGTLGTQRQGLGKALYPPKVYVPSSAFLRRLHSAGQFPRGVAEGKPGSGVAA